MKKKNDTAAQNDLAGSADLLALGGNGTRVPSADMYDLSIVNGRLIDPGARVDAPGTVGIASGKIAAVSSGPLPARRTIDARGLVICPGFIDIHTHVDGNVNAARSMAAMGVTTVVGGNCGMAAVPEGMDVGAFLSRIDRDGFPVNHAMLAGATAIREHVGIAQNARAEDRLLEEMAHIAGDALDRGAVGISFGLEYVPGTGPRDIRTLCAAAAGRGAIVTVHPRHSGRGMPGMMPGAAAAYREMIDASGATGAAVEFSHMGSQLAWKSRPHDGLVRTCLGMIERARDAGLDIAGDAYPYDAWCTYAGAANLDPFLKGEPTRSIMRFRYLLEIGMLEVASGPHTGTHLTRKLLAEIRSAAPGTWIVGHTLQQDLVEEILIRPYVVVGSDGVFDFTTGSPSHPRGSGTFPRFLRLAREKNLMGLSDALGRMTSMPAARFGLENKGTLAVGADADVTVFDPARVADTSTYTEPTGKPVGIEYVIVGGTPVVDRGALTAAAPGRAVRRGA